MTPAPISVERLRELLSVMTGSDPNRMADFPGGCDCHECGCIFIGGDGHDYCAQCEAKRQLLAVLPEALPALLHQLEEMEAEVESTLACNRGLVRLNEAVTARAESAERAREEIEAAMAWYFDHSGHVVRANGQWFAITGRDELTQFDDGIGAIVAAFLAASEGSHEPR